MIESRLVPHVDKAPLPLRILRLVTGIAIYRKEGSFRGRKVPSAEGRYLYGRKLLNKFISKIIL